MEIRSTYRKYRNLSHLSMGVFMGPKPTQTVAPADELRKKILIWSVRFESEISKSDHMISIQDQSGKLSVMDTILFWEPK